MSNVIHIYNIKINVYVRFSCEKKNNECMLKYFNTSF